MRSFRLWVGEGQELSGAGCGFLLVTMLVTLVAALLLTERLVQLLGRDRMAMMVIAAGAIGFWWTGCLVFRCLGKPLIVPASADRLEEQDREGSRERV